MDYLKIINVDDFTAELVFERAHVDLNTNIIYHYDVRYKSLEKAVSGFAPHIITTCLTSSNFVDLFFHETYNNEQQKMFAKLIDFPLKRLKIEKI